MERSSLAPIRIGGFLKHDGSRHHGVGIQLTVPIEPTAKGIAHCREEVLEKAVEVLGKKLGQG